MSTSTVIMASVMKIPFACHIIISNAKNVLPQKWNPDIEFRTILITWHFSANPEDLRLSKIACCDTIFLKQLIYLSVSKCIDSKFLLAVFSRDREMITSFVYVYNHLLEGSLNYVFKKYNLRVLQRENTISVPDILKSY